MASGWDVREVSYSDQQLVRDDNVNREGKRHESQAKFRQFIREYRVENIYIYREQLLANCAKNSYSLLVDLADLSGFNPDLHTLLRQQPADYLPLFESAAKEVYAGIQLRETEVDKIPDIQVSIVSNENPKRLRNLQSTDVSRLVQVSGIVIAASKAQVKATKIAIQCRNCRFVKHLSVKKGFGGAVLPRKCDNQQNEGEEAKKCPLDPFQIMPDMSKYVDQQTLKVQETPEMVPTGEMPRNILVSVDRSLVDKVSPGARVTVMGIYATFDRNNRNLGAVAIRTPYLRAVGLKLNGEGSSRASVTFTPEEEEQFAQLARDGNVYDKISRSIGTSIFGSEDIKKAIACLLFGGSRKRLPDGMRLRGDINVLLLGDPSTAKSQFLKFVERVAPIGVYTSGKGSSAAGLTASVVKDNGSGEFYLEGGAMVLADGGVVCIDEFDKMRPQDRVAIHEAMEQQTISIAKAGITTILNSRCSVLAAANPVFGRYDDMKEAAEQIDFQTTILSRFDLIFIVRDIRNDEQDQTLARHILKLHKGGRAVDQDSAAELSVDFLKKYISYCRHKIAPRLSEEAATKLQGHYVKVRDEMRTAQVNAKGAPTIPITVRQLEAIVRISESLAKMSLSNQATAEHVDEAIRLFKVSTLQAAHSSPDGSPMDALSSEAMNDVLKVEEHIRRKVAIGSFVSEQKLIMDLMKQGHSEFIIKKALHIMLQRTEMDYRHGKHMLKRLR
eukprot:GILK01002292.1.p1 GENE.GILK01002292.1~~GILK01002292.1.p1  ORF type:complete len:727 (+),score=126.75 GILK01002292.1:66-2246(+)